MNKLLAKALIGQEVQKSLPSDLGMAALPMLYQRLGLSGIEDRNPRRVSDTVRVAGARSLRQLADQYGWAHGKQWGATNELLDLESEGNRLAQNPNSTAFGRWQFLDSTWAAVGGHKTKNRRLQDIYGLRYIDQRYGSPLAALRFHRANNYY